MMKFRHNETGQIFNGDMELRLAYPTVSFPMFLDQNALDFANVSVVVEVLEPQTTATQRAQYDGVQLVNGQWMDTWSIHPKYDDPAEQTAWEAEVIEIKWNQIRATRDQLLKDTDYTDLPNTPITTQCRNNFLVYRQALRDITGQVDPDNITWPEKPQYELQT